MCWVGNAAFSEATEHSCIVGNEDADITEIWKKTDGESDRKRGKTDDRRVLAGTVVM